MMKRILPLLILFTPLFSIGQFTAIPDANFEQALIDQGHDTGTPDGEVLTANISGLTFLDVSSNLIGNLSGIQDFTALTFLDCSGNNLTSLDVSSNNALTYLVCYSNQLTSLDISNNTALTLLSFSNNQIISLDLSNNTFLTDLYCEYNQLTSLDVSNNTVLIRLHCFFNQLECLNIKNGNNNNMIIFLADANPNLTCIDVDDVNYSTANWTNIDPQTSFSTDCNNACSNTSSLTELTTSKNLIQILDMMGRETIFKPNTPLIYVYDDGSIEKVFNVAL